MDINISNNKYSNVEVTNKIRLNNFNLGDYDNIVYINKLITTTNNLFTLNKSNSTYIVRNYNSNIYKKYITEVKKLDKDTFISENHNLKKNDIIRLFNIRRSNPNINLLKSNLQDTDLKYKVLYVTRNSFILVTLNNITDILITSYNKISEGYFELDLDSSNLDSSNSDLEELNINIENNTEDEYGIFYNLIIDSNIKHLRLSTINNDRLNGYILLNNKEIIGPDYLETCSNKKTLNISNIDLENSRIELINVAKNDWFIKCNIPNNTIEYILTYDKDYKINGNELGILEFYKHYIYIIDISSNTLYNDTIPLIFVIVDSNNIHYYKNIIKFGEMGTPGSYIKIYIDNTENTNTIYTLKYKNNDNYKYVPFYIIKDTPIYFS